MPLLLFIFTCLYLQELNLTFMLVLIVISNIFIDKIIIFQLLFARMFYIT